MRKNPKNRINIKFCTSIHFVDNQLFPSLIGISPLITIHYKSLLRLRIRSSSFLSKTFNLIIISSHRFRVYKSLFHNSFQFAFRLINLYNSLTHYAKGTSFSSDCFSHCISSSFHSIFMVLFIVPSRYYTLSIIDLYFKFESGFPIFNFFFTFIFNNCQIYGISPIFSIF